MATAAGDTDASEVGLLLARVFFMCGRRHGDESVGGSVCDLARRRRGTPGSCSRVAGQTCAKLVRACARRQVGPCLLFRYDRPRLRRPPGLALFSFAGPYFPFPFLSFLHFILRYLTAYPSSSISHTPACTSSNPKTWMQQPLAHSPPSLRQSRLAKRGRSPLSASTRPNKHIASFSRLRRPLLVLPRFPQPPQTQNPSISRRPPNPGPRT